MKKLIILLSLLLLLCSAASAEVITAMAVEPYMETYALYASYARIHGYNREANTLEVELTAPEVFRRDDVEGIKVGDAIFTGGREVAVASITEEDGYIVLNKGEYEFSEGSVWLCEDINGNYRPAYYDDYIWLDMAHLELPVTDRLLFLDMIDPATGETLEKPTVHSAEDFLQIKAREESEQAAGPGFCANNVLVIFDQEGQLAVIRRFYVPWQ